MYWNRRALLGSAAAATMIPRGAALPLLAGGMVLGSVEEALAADQKLSALTLGTQSDYIYGIQSNASRKFSGLPFLNVKDFGAVGDGMNDDTAAIQACLDAAYSNGLNYKANKAVCFPGGVYIVSHPVYIMDTAGAHLFGVDRLSTQIVNTSGASCSFTASIASSGGSDTGIMTVTAVSSGQLYVGSIIAATGVDENTTICSFGTGTGGTGTYRVLSPPVDVTSRSMTATHGTAMYLNGCMYSTFERMTFQGTGDGSGLDYDWGRENTDNNGGQLNLFTSVGFGGRWGCRVGVSGSQCDTSTWINCNFSNLGSSPKYGLGIYNQNSLAHNVFGGDFQSCGTGIYCGGGYIASIIGVAFQISYVADIVMSGSTGNGVLISSIDSESTNFLTIQGSQAAYTITGVGHRGTGIDGNFLTGNPAATIITGCYSKNGDIRSAVFPLTMDACSFDRLDALDHYIAGGQADLQRAEIRNTYLGDSINSIARLIEQKVIKNARIRNHGVEATSITTDITYLYDSIQTGNALAYRDATISNSSPAVITLTGTHKLLNGMVVAFTTTGTLPSPLVANKAYYVVGPVTGTQNITITIASPAVITDTAHGFFANDAIFITTDRHGGVLPTGISSQGTYYVKTVLDANSYTISATPGGTVINTSGTQSGTHQRSVVPMLTLRVAPNSGAAAVNTTTAGSGTHKMYLVRKIEKGDVVTKSDVAAGGSPGWICTTTGYTVDDATPGASAAVMKALANVAA